MKCPVCDVVLTVSGDRDLLQHPESQICDMAGCWLEQRRWDAINAAIRQAETAKEDWWRMACLRAVAVELGEIGPGTEHTDENLRAWQEKWGGTPSMIIGSAIRQARAVPCPSGCPHMLDFEGERKRLEARIAELERELAEARRPKRFPIQAEPGILNIPWEIALKAYATYKMRHGSDQSLERLAERGGFGGKEMDVLLPGWRELAEALKPDK